MNICFDSIIRPAAVMSTPTVKPDVLILHAGWHTPASYAKLTTGLEEKGFKVHVPLLPTMDGVRPPTADLFVDTEFVREYVGKLADEGTELLVLMHSYGGQVGTNALAGLGASERAREGKKGGVVRLVYMVAYAVAEGMSIMKWAVSQGFKDLLPLAFDFQDDGIVMCRDPKALIVGEGFPDAETDAHLATFSTWATKSWTDEIQHCAWRGIPVTYIQALQDKCVPPVYQKAFIEIMTSSGDTSVDVATIDTAHSPNLTATAQVVDIVLGLAAKVKPT